MNEKFLKISFLFFFALKFLLRPFKHIVFQRRKSLSNLKKQSKHFLSSFRFQIINYFKYSEISRSSTLPFWGLYRIYQNFQILISKISSEVKKFVFSYVKFSNVPKTKKKEVKKYGLGIISCITSNI